MLVYYLTYVDLHEFTFSPLLQEHIQSRVSIFILIIKIKCKNHEEKLLIFLYKSDILVFTIMLLLLINKSRLWRALISNLSERILYIKFLLHVLSLTFRRILGYNSLKSHVCWGQELFRNCSSQICLGILMCSKLFFLTATIVFKKKISG